jgi:hypothetical protein
MGGANLGPRFWRLDTPAQSKTYFETMLGGQLSTGPILWQFCDVFRRLSAPSHSRRNSRAVTMRLRHAFPCCAHSLSCCIGLFPTKRRSSRQGGCVIESYSGTTHPIHLALFGYGSLDLVFDFFDNSEPEGSFSEKIPSLLEFATVMTTVSQ